MKTFLVAFALLLAAFSTRVFAQPATALDSSFSQDGILDVDSLQLTSVGKIYIALQTDGKIVTAGTYGYWAGTYQMGAQLMRFHPNGDRDSSFGQNGALWLRGNANENCIGLHVLPDGRIMTASASSVLQGNSYTLHRRLSSGAPDPSFNDSGKVVFAPTTFQGHIYYNTLAVQSDGGILLSGHWSVPPLYHFLNTFRHTTTGAPDSAYGFYGRASVELFNTFRIDARTISAQPDGSFFVGGQAQDTPLSLNRNKAVLARCLSNGTLDPGFGQGLGYFKHATAGERHSAITSVLVRPNGKILIAVVGQRRFDGPSICSVMQLTSTGDLDPSFANGGIAEIDSTASDALRSCLPQIALQADGRVLLSFADGISDTTQKFAVRRLTVNGAPDNSFGAAGKVTTRVSVARSGGASAIAVQPNGKILAVGPSTHLMSGYTSLSLVRYHPFISFTNVPTVSEDSHPLTLHVYPNPVLSDALHIEYTMPANGDVRIELRDIQGRIAATLLLAKRDVGKCDEQLHLPSALAPGSYLLCVRGAGLAASAALVKQ